jgi:anti-sigma regulatory factor (Ser/Thr protein kinase)
VSGPVVRRLRLPPVDTSPGAARRAVAAVLDEAGLNRLRPDALLLTSELVTNGVVHARTDLDVDIVADSDGIRVAVTDFAPPDARLVVAEVTAGARRPATARLDEAQPAEGGRGLLLVSRFATRWGTTHEAGGRQVWFHLDRPSTAGPAGGTVTRDTSPTVERALDSLLGRVGGAPADAANRAAPAGPADLVGRLAVGLGAATVTVVVDRADGGGPRLFARHTSVGPGADDGRTVQAPLPLRRPWSGTVTVTGARGRHAEPVTALAAAQLGLLVENQRLHEAHSDGRGWLLFLAEAGELLAQSMNVELTVALLPRLVVPRLGHWCAVHVTNEYGELNLAALTHTDETAVAPLAEALAGRLDGLAQAMVGEGFGPLEPSTDSMSFPLTMRGERLGVLTAGRPAGRPHTPDELAIIADLARRAAVAIENARIHDNRRRIATTLQRSLLPPQLPAIDGLEVAAQYVPAGDGLDVGGDFYDVVPLPGHGWMFVVGDVSGKDAGAAAVTGMVRDVLHALAAEYRAPEHTLRRLNATLVERGGGYFCTLALAFLTAATRGAFDLSLHLAGHDQPVLLHADGRTSLVGECGTALGLLGDIHSPRTTVHLGHGDSLVFYTDGVTERRRGSRLYGHHRLQSEIAALAGSPASVLAARLRSSVLSFSATPPRDDIAIVALRAL